MGGVVEEVEEETGRAAEEEVVEEDEEEGARAEWVGTGAASFLILSLEAEEE